MPSKKKTKYPGDCFEAAGRLLLNLPAEYDEFNYRLVHGNIPTLPQDEVVNHA